jgi:two-component system response regulator HydG
LGKHEKSLGDLVNLYEKEILKKSLEINNGHKTKVAKVLKIDRKTLFNKMKKYELDS